MFYAEGREARGWMAGDALLSWWRLGVGEHRHGECGVYESVREGRVCCRYGGLSVCLLPSVESTGLTEWDRLAPEHPWPAAVHDCWEAMLWLISDGVSALQIDTTKMATGGSSAGGNLAAIITHKALTLSPPVRFLTQLLSVPVMDNTAMVENNWSYRMSEHTPALPAPKMLWYRNHYLPNQADWANPEASPLFYQDDWSKLPPALIMVGELDVLRAEGEQYADKLKKAGVEVDLQVMKGMPHPFLAMDGVLKEGKRSITLMVDGLKKAFS